MGKWARRGVYSEATENLCKGVGSRHVLEILAFCLLSLYFQKPRTLQLTDCVIERESVLMPPLSTQVGAPPRQSGRVLEKRVSHNEHCPKQTARGRDPNERSRAQAEQACYELECFPML